MKLERVRKLKAQIEVIIAAKALGFYTDNKLSDLASLAAKRLDYEPEYKSLVKSKELLENDAISKLEQAKKPTTEAGIMEILDKRKEYQLLLKAEKQIFDREIDDFKFEPVVLAPSDDLSEKFKVGAIQIAYAGMRYVIDPYLTLHELIQEGFIKLKEA